MTRKTRSRAVARALGAALVFTAAAPAVGQTAGDGYQAPPTRRVSLGVGKSMLVDLPRDAAEIFVADPKVANAVVRSSRKLYVIATGGGQTSIYAMDAQGHQIAAIELSIGRDIGELASILRIALPKSTIVARTVNDSIILTGVVESAGDVQTAMDIAKGFVTSVSSGASGSAQGLVVNGLSIRGRDQVMLKVTVAEIRRQVLKQLGVSNAIASGNWGTVSVNNPFSVNGAITSTAASLGNYNGLASGALTRGIGAQIQAYERQGVARILAEPTVTAISGESAKFTAGGQIPVPTGATCVNGICTTGVTFKDYGVTLNFTPVVVNEGRILLRIATEVSDIDPTITINISGSPVPGFRTRKNETSVELPSGGSIVSAGLIQTTSQQAINGLPALMNLPVLGALFRSRDYQRQETELLIAVTPYIAKPVKPSEVALPTDGFADATDPQAVLLGRVNRLYSTTSNPQAVGGFRGRIGFIND